MTTATDFAATRAFFDLPEGVTYLDGNSLGPLPRAVPERLAQAARHDWGGKLIGGWNDAGWMEMPDRLGDRIAPLIGAPAGSVTLGDTLSVKVYQALAAALALNPDRRVILSCAGNFPSDLYIAQGLARTLERGHDLRTPPPEEVEAHLSEEVAVLMLTEVDYRTGRRHDMARLSARAHELGIVTVWDLAHSAGALPVDMAGCGAAFAVGCTYKYLNSGPGGPAFIHVRPDLAQRIDPALAGWLGHEAPFAFDPDYRPAPAVMRMRVGTPPVLQMVALETALEVWDMARIEDVRARSVALSQRFIDAVEASCPALTLASPRAPEDRGSQVSFRHPEGYAIMQALIAGGVVGDFRAPDILRFGITPLYLDEADIDRAAESLAHIVNRGLWDAPEFRARKPVT
ncbi:kynureninase [Palleronia sediminis]|uniref:Kynureninase n=1 Tax=Palleronia sediminis TaxID=2547833 RepID=A0A4R6A9Q1_9RHOB|nr:kynureninase [Palleronia sediminis]TDL79717.1 kynureninase [Palleronia sediminis]